MSVTITTYNFQGGRQLDDQDYAFCMRQERGFCSFQLTQSEVDSPTPFLLRDGTAAPDSFADPAAIEVIKA